MGAHTSVETHTHSPYPQVQGELEEDRYSGLCKKLSVLSWGFESEEHFSIQCATLCFYHVNDPGDLAI